MEARGGIADKSGHVLMPLFSGQARPGSVLPHRHMLESLGALELASVPVSPMNLTCEAHPARPGKGKGHYTFLLQRSGQGELQQFGHQAVLTAGDLTLYDPAQPWRFRALECGEVILLQVPAGLLAEHLPSPESLCGQRLGCTEGLTATAGAMAATLAGQLRDGLDEVSRQRAASHLLGMIASCYAATLAAAVPHSAVMSNRLWRVRAHIEENLRNPQLCPALVAADLKLSPRYLRMIFAASEEPILAYILRRRLEECAAQLADPRWRGHSITEIAFGWGFNSAPHFTRSFRDRFAASPRQYRQRQLAGPDRLAA